MNGLSINSLQSDLARCDREMAECLEHIENGGSDELGALQGLGDWAVEKDLIQQGITNNMTPYYEDSMTTIYCGEALDILPTIYNIDLVVTDPPYMINSKSDGSGKLNPWVDYLNMASWYTLWFKECRRLLSPIGAMWAFLNWRSMVTYQRASCDSQWPIESLLVWDKAVPGCGGVVGLRPSYELVALYTMPQFAIKDRSIRDIYKARWSSTKPNGHPAEKPLTLISWILSISGGSTVLDPFMGSGTTLVAAKRLGRRAIGIEIDEKWCAVAVDRLRQAEMFAEDEQIHEMHPVPNEPAFLKATLFE